jgi:hypothetical protein
MADPDRTEAATWYYRLELDLWRIEVEALLGGPTVSPPSEP